MTTRRVRLAGSVALGITAALTLSAPAALASASGPGVTIGPGQGATLTIQTVPVVPGARVLLDGRTYLTNAAGAVTIATFPGRHVLGIRPPSRLRPGTGVRFSRWLDGIALADRTLSVHQGVNRQEVGFELSHPIAVRFATKSGHPVPMSAISSITMANSLGARFTFAPSDPPALLAANRIVRVQSGLYVLPIRYSVRVVLFAGSNVVYAGSQNFFVRPGEVWTVKVLLFPMRLEVRDALFGFGIGSAVRIRMSNGTSRVVALGAGHAVTIPNMPRSTYQLIAKGPGIGLSAPATLTKPLVAKLLLLSWVDIAAVVVFFAGFIVGLPLIGGRIIRGKGRRGRLLAWHVGHPERVTAAAPVVTPGKPVDNAGDKPQTDDDRQQPTEPWAGHAAPEPKPGAVAEPGPTAVPEPWAAAAPEPRPEPLAAPAPEPRPEPWAPAAPGPGAVNGRPASVARADPAVVATDSLSAVFGANPMAVNAMPPTAVPMPDSAAERQDEIVGFNHAEGDDVTEIIPAIVASVPDPVAGQDRGELERGSLA